MTQEQKELLYHISCIHSYIFYLEMNDHWSSWDYEQSAILKKELEKFEKEYGEKYGPLPDWNKLIDSMWIMRDKFKRELKENE